MFISNVGTPRRNGQMPRLHSIWESDYKPQLIKKNRRPANCISEQPTYTAVPKVEF